MIEILNKLNAEFIEDCGSAYEINNGSCEEWADEAFSRLEQLDIKVELWATPYFFADTTHSFIRVNGKFIDAECLEGVDDHNDLPIFRKLIALGKGRQPVWLENTNHDSKENIRDISLSLAKEIRQEQIKSGVEPSRALKYGE